MNLLFTTPLRARVALAALLASALIASPSWALKRPAKAPDPKIAFERYTLDNGLEVLLIPDAKAAVVAVDVWYHVGSGHEVPGKSGFAHLFEHMLFQGSAHVGVDRHFDILKAIGSDEVNGTTNTDRTNYYEVVPPNQLEAALWLESDRMGYLLPLLTNEAFQNQIEVVRNERRQRIDNRPYGKTMFATLAAVYPEGHPYRYSVIGRHEDLAAATLDDVKGFYKTWYAPANATLAISGNFDVAETKKLVSKWFGSFPKSTKPTMVSVPPPTLKAQAVAVEDGLAKLRKLDLTWVSPANFAAGDAELDIAADVLGAEGRGRLYRTLVIEKRLAQQVSVYQMGMQHSGTFNISVMLLPGADEGAIKSVIADEVAALIKAPISTRELARMATQMESAFVHRLESTLDRAEVLQTFNHYLGDADKLTWYLDRYRNTTPEAVRATVATYLGAAFVTTLTSPQGAAK